MADFKEFPKWLYNSDGLAVVVDDKDQQDEQEKQGFHEWNWKQPEQPEATHKPKK